MSFHDKITGKILDSYLENLVNLYEQSSLSDIIDYKFFWIRRIQVEMFTVEKVSDCLQ